MKNWLARTFIMSIGMIVGGAIGASFVFLYFAENFKAVNHMLALGYCAWESEEALFQYKNGSTEIAKYSLAHYASISEGFKEYNKKTNSNFIPATGDLGFTYVRLGNIAEKEGKIDIADEYFQKALQNYKDHCDSNNINHKYTKEELRNLVNRIDEKNDPIVRKSFISIFINKEN